MSKLISTLKEAGFYKIEDNLDGLCSYATKMSALAGNKENPGIFEALPSFIKIEPPKQSSNCMVIDIGGTSTKVAVRMNSSWRFLFEIRNLDLEPQETQHSFEFFCNILTKKIRDSLRHYGIRRKHIESVAVVWSNAIENQRKNDTLICGTVTKRENYTKGEWFNRDLKNGDDLCDYILGTLKQFEITPSKFLITNDTPLTLKATPNADSGMIASTGLNTTILKTEKELGISDSKEKIVCNSEAGGRFSLTKDLLTDIDCYNGEKEKFIEFLSSGKFIPELFVEYTDFLAKNGFSELTEIANSLDASTRYKEFRTRDLSLVIYDPEFFISRRSCPSIYSEGAIKTLKELSEEISKRAAKIASLCAFVGIANILDEKDEFLISLDSRLSRGIEIFWSSLNHSLESILPEDKKARLNLVHPLELKGNNISVPMLGAANVL